MRTRSFWGITILVLTLSCGFDAFALAPEKASDLVSVETIFLPSQIVPSQINSPACPDEGHSGITRARQFTRKVDGAGVTQFTIPPGQVFVVTSFDWIVTTEPSRNVIAMLRVEQLGVNSVSAYGMALADSIGRAGSSQSLGSGIVLREGQKLCLSISESPAGSLLGTARGFFTPDR